jgi:hypothetical protein
MKAVVEKFKILQEKVNNIRKNSELSEYYDLINYCATRTQAQNIEWATKMLKLRDFKDPIQEEDLRIFRAYCSIDKKIKVENMNYLIEDLDFVKIDKKALKQQIIFSINQENNLEDLYKWGDHFKELQFDYENINAMVLIQIKDHISSNKDIDYNIELLIKYIKSDISNSASIEDILRTICFHNQIKNIEVQINPNNLSMIKQLLIAKEIKGKQTIDKILALNVSLTIIFCHKYPEFSKANVNGSEYYNELLFNNLNANELQILYLEFNNIKGIKGGNQVFLQLQKVEANNTNYTLKVQTVQFLRPLIHELQERTQRYELFNLVEYRKFFKQIQFLQENLTQMNRFVKISSENLVISKEGKLLLYRLEEVTQDQMMDTSLIQDQIKRLSVD